VLDEEVFGSVVCRHIIQGNIYNVIDTILLQECTTITAFISSKQVNRNRLLYKFYVTIESFGLFFLETKRIFSMKTR